MRNYSIAQIFFEKILSKLKSRYKNKKIKVTNHSRAIGELCLGHTFFGVFLGKVKSLMN
jgi:hypothetical protein